MKASRVFTHRTHGRIGHAELEQNGNKWTLDGKELPEASVEYLMTFALQSLQDAYAGADNADEAQANFNKKREKLIAGTIGVRTGNGGEEPHMAFVRQLIRKAMKGGSKALPDDAQKTYDAIPSDDQQKRKEYVNELFNGLPDDVRGNVEAKAKELHAADVAAKQAAKKAAEDIGL